MGILYKSLCSNVRKHKSSELTSDIQSGSIYMSPRLNPTGLKQWQILLMTAVTQHDDEWLKNQILHLNLLNPTNTNIKGVVSKMPSNAAEMLAEGEFNRLYCRGVCLEAIANGEEEVEVYRGKSVTTPRPDSQALIGTRVCPKKLLTDLRTHQGVDTALGLPGGPNSGLTVKRLKD